MIQYFTTFVDINNLPQQEALTKIAQHILDHKDQKLYAFDSLSWLWHARHDLINDRLTLEEFFVLWDVTWEKDLRAHQYGGLPELHAFVQSDDNTPQALVVARSFLAIESIHGTLLQW